MRKRWQLSLVTTVVVLGMTAGSGAQVVTIVPTGEVEAIVRGFAEVYLKESAELAIERQELRFIALYRHMARRLEAYQIKVPSILSPEGEIRHGHLQILDQFLFWGEFQPSHRSEAPRRLDLLWGRVELPFQRFLVRHPVSGKSQWFSELFLLEEGTSLPMSERSMTLGSGLIIHRKKAWQEVAAFLTEHFRKLGAEKRRPGRDDIFHLVWESWHTPFERRATDESFTELLAQELLKIARAHEICHAFDMAGLPAELFNAYRSAPLAYQFIETRGWLAAFENLDGEPMKGLLWWFLLQDTPIDPGAKVIIERVIAELGLSAGYLEAKTDGQPIDRKAIERLLRAGVREQKRWAAEAIKRLEGETEALLARLRSAQAVSAKSG